MEQLPKHRKPDIREEFCKILAPHKPVWRMDNVHDVPFVTRTPEPPIMPVSPTVKFISTAPFISPYL